MSSWDTPFDGHKKARDVAGARGSLADQSGWLGRSIGHKRYHKSLDDVTPADVYDGRINDILDQFAMVMASTMSQSKIHNLRLAD